MRVIDGSYDGINGFNTAVLKLMQMAFGASPADAQAAHGRHDQRTVTILGSVLDDAAKNDAADESDLDIGLASESE